MTRLPKWIESVATGQDLLAKEIYMAKKRTMEEDLGVLKKKVTEGRAKTENQEGDAGLRRLRRHLKRTQRKVRARVARIAQASGKKKASEG